MSVDPETVRKVYHKIVDAAEECGVALIAERLYIVDLKTGAATSMQIMPRGRESQEHGE